MRALNKAKVGLPRSKRYVLQADENEVLEADTTRTDPPFSLGRVLHVLVFHFLGRGACQQAATVRTVAPSEGNFKESLKTHLNKTLDHLRYMVG